MVINCLLKKKNKKNITSILHKICINTWKNILREALKKNQNVNFFQIGPDPPTPLEIWAGIFEEKNFKQILTCLRTLHTSFTNFDILTMYLVVSDFVKTGSILKFYLIFNPSKIQFRQCELWGRLPPPPFGKSSDFEFIFLEGFPKVPITLS